MILDAILHARVIVCDQENRCYTFSVRQAVPRETEPVLWVELTWATFSYDDVGDVYRIGDYCSILSLPPFL